MDNEREVRVKNFNEEKITFWKVIWGLSLLSTILLTWADLRSQVKLLEVKIEQVYTKTEVDGKVQTLANEDRIQRIRIKNVENRLGIRSGE